MDTPADVPPPLPGTPAAAPTPATPAAAPAAAGTTEFGSLRKAWDSLKTVKTADDVDAAVEKIRLDDKALGNWYARYAKKTQGGQLKYDAAKGELTGGIGQRLEILSELSDITSETREALSRYTSKSGVTGPVNPAIQKQANRIERDLQKSIVDHLRAEKTLAEAAEKMGKELNKIHDAEVKRITKGSKTLSTETQAEFDLFAEKFKGFSDKVMSQYTDKIELHRNAIDEAKTIVGNLEGSGVKLNLKWSLDELSAGERAAAEAASKTESSTLDHAADAGKKAGGHMGMTLGGAGAGAVIGYMMSDDDNKGKGGLVGAGVGAIVGRLVSGFRKAGSTAMGAVHSPAEASKFADLTKQAASHIRG